MRGRLEARPRPPGAVPRAAPRVRCQAVIQLAGALRALGQPHASAGLLPAEQGHTSDYLDDAPTRVPRPDPRRPRPGLTGGKIRKRRDPVRSEDRTGSRELFPSGLGRSVTWT
ncbi:tetratricopeptide repeat protein [Streptomyces griseoluteus]|uniref:tetratricopeptide repeat protein n=1 Tax=Streptomyces griseoluteus TaxID=29306 RepID=UPI00380D1704